MSKTISPTILTEMKIFFLPDKEVYLRVLARILKVGAQNSSSQKFWIKFKGAHDIFTIQQSAIYFKIKNNN